MDATQVQKLIYAIVSTLICCAIALLYAYFSKNGKRIQIGDIVISIVLVVVSSLRYGVGSDYFRYMESAAGWANQFSDLGSLFSPETLQKYSFEIGYKFLSVISSWISSSEYTIFWVVSIVIYIPIVVYCRKNTCNSHAALAVFLLFGYWGLSLNIIQQFIAMVLILYATLALEKKKYIAFFLLVLCAETFHTTAIVAAIVILIVHSGVLKKILEPTKRNLAIMVFAGVVLNGATTLFTSLISYFPGFEKYVNYLNADATDRIGRKHLWIGVLIETVLVVVFLYLAIKKHDKLKERNPRITRVMSIIMVGIPFSIIGISRTLWLANRFAEFFFLLIIVLIPELIQSDEPKEKKLGTIVICKNQILFWLALIGWHAIFAVIMRNNNTFAIDTYLFK